MDPLPTTDLRSNLLTLAVPTHQLPATATRLCDALGLEPYDPYFRGQELKTTYFDTPDFALRKARRLGDQYLTLRVRCYRNYQGEELYALSAKTESQKFRVEIDPTAAGALLGGQLVLLAELLPVDLQARLYALTGGASLVPVVTVGCHRYAVENDQERLTLDVHVKTDVGKCLPFHVLEFKSSDPQAGLPPGLRALGLRPIKLSKFLWATDWR